MGDKERNIRMFSLAVTAGMFFMWFVRYFGRK